MTKKIMYKGKPTDLIDEWEYEFYKAIGRYYKGLVLRNNGILVYINKENAGIGVTNDMSRIAIRQAIVLGAAREDVVYDPIIVAEAKEKLASKVPSIASKTNFFYGLGALAMESMPIIFNKTNGKLFNPQYLGMGSIGQTLSKIEAYKFMRVGKFLGYGSVVFGIGLDLYGLRLYSKNPDLPNAVNPLKAGLNTGMAVYGLLVPGGALASTLYFGVGEFYPGGWSQALDDRDRMEKENQKIVPGFKLTPKPAW